MSDPAAASGDKEPSTSIGQKFAQFYRAHRTEVIGGVGVVVAGYAYYRSKHSSSSATAATNATDTSTTASGIDPNTGVPYATELADAQSGASSAGSIYPSGTDDGSTGYSGAGADGNGGYGADIVSSLQGIQTTLNNGIQVTGEPPASTSTTSSQTGGSPQATTGASKTPAENLANLDAELAKDKKINTPAAKKSVATLNKQISAVKARS